MTTARSIAAFVAIIVIQLLVGALVLVVWDDWLPEDLAGWVALAVFGWFTGFAVFAVGSLLYGMFALRKLGLPAFPWRPKPPPGPR